MCIKFYIPGVLFVLGTSKHVHGLITSHVYIKKHGHFAHAQLISCRFWFYRQWIFDFNNNAEEAKYGISYHILILHESTKIKTVKNKMHPFFLFIITKDNKAPCYFLAIKTLQNSTDINQKQITFCAVIPNDKINFLLRY